MAHNVPLRSRDAVTLEMARLILNQYLEGRQSGLSVIHSKRWAIYAGESVRFGRGVPSVYYKNEPCAVSRLKARNREKSVWYLGTSKHANSKDFDRIMRGTLGTTRFLGIPRTVNGWMQDALKRHKKELWADLKTAAENYKNIVGIAPSPTNEVFTKIHRQWLKIHRGRNLFIRGFGKFDIDAAVKRLQETHSGILRPIEITASGYGFSNYWSLKNMKANKTLFRYYLKYQSFWRTNINRLDEIFGEPAIQRIRENPDIPPQTLLAILDRIRQEREQWYLNGHGGNFSSEPFAHLEGAPSVETPFGVLRPLKSPQELRAVGTAMKNCATNYVGSIMRKSTLLLALFDESGNPIALGEVQYDPEVKRWVWGQRLGPGNKDLERNLYEVFQAYPLVASGIWKHDDQDLISD